MNLGARSFSCVLLGMLGSLVKSFLLRNTRPESPPFLAEREDAFVAGTDLPWPPPSALTVPNSEEEGEKEATGVLARGRDAFGPLSLRSAGAASLREKECAFGSVAEIFLLEVSS